MARYDPFDKISEDLLRLLPSGDRIIPDITHNLSEQQEVNWDRGVMTNASRKDIIRARMEALEAELVELDSFGVDNYDIGTCLIFDQNFGNLDSEGVPIIYTYAAVKAPNKLWYLTSSSGGSQQPRSWDQLVNFWKDKVQTIVKVKETEKVFERNAPVVIEASPLRADGSGHYGYDEKRKVRDNPQA
jgi:hypothetical protein